MPRMGGAPGAAGGKPRRADDAHAHAVARAAAGEPVSAAQACELERGALQVKPAERAADGDTEVLDNLL